MKQDKVLFVSIVGFFFLLSIGLAAVAYVLSDLTVLYYRPVRALSSGEVWESLICLMIGLFAFLMFIATAFCAWYFNPWWRGVEEGYGRRILSVPYL